MTWTRLAARRSLPLIAVALVGSCGSRSHHAGLPDFANPSTDPSSRFGAEVRVLGSGHVVVTDPVLTVGGVKNAGAVYLFDGQTGTLISTLSGSAPNEAVGGGGVGVLANGNFLVFSNYGAFDPSHPGVGTTFVHGTTDLDGTVSAANTLFQSGGNTSPQPVPCLTGQPALPQATCEGLLGNLVTPNPGSGGLSTQGSAFALGLPPLANETFTYLPLPNGSYVALGVGSNAATFGNGTTGVSGLISSSNSLIGTGLDNLGAAQSVLTPMAVLSGVTVLPSGNYVASATNPTFGRRTTGVSGTIPVAGNPAGPVTELVNGNFVVVSAAGVATLYDGTTFAPIASLIGNASSRAVALRNGNFVLVTPTFGGGAGAVTFVDGTVGLAGVVAPANSLVGVTPTDAVGSGGVTPLANGNYVVRSPQFAGGAGAATLCSGTSATAAPVSPANSLFGSAPGDAVAGTDVVALANGNYVVVSATWSNGVSANAGAATFGNGTVGFGAIGPVTPFNSLVGAVTGEQVGSGGVTPLPAGGYVVASPLSGGGAGAATFGNGISGVVGIVTPVNSLTGIQPTDAVSSGGVVVLANGNYVVVSPAWANGPATSAGAVTFCNGATGVTGPVSMVNSLVGTLANERVGGGVSHDEDVVVRYPASTANAIHSTNLRGVVPLLGGGYVVLSPDYGGGLGAATFGDGTSGVSGTVTAANSLVGAVPGDHVGGGGVRPLPNGNYLVLSPCWSSGGSFGAGAVTFGFGTIGVSGAVSAANSLVGASAGDFVGFTGMNMFTPPPAMPLLTGPTIYQTLFAQGGGSGSGLADLAQFGVTPGMPSSLTGQVTILSNGNYVVMSPYSFGEMGSVTLCDGTTGRSGTLSAANSLVGTVPLGYLGSEVHENSRFGTFLVSGRPEMARAAVNLVVSPTKP